MKLLVTIINRNHASKISKIFEEENINIQFISYGNGTADSDLAEYFGIGQVEKEVLFSFVDDEDVTKILSLLSTKKDFISRNGGVAFTISVTSIGKKTLEFFQNNFSEVSNGE
jgi:hypothetical protein